MPARIRASNVHRFTSVQYILYRRIEGEVDRYRLMGVGGRSGVGDACPRGIVEYSGALCYCLRFEGADADPLGW